MTPEIGIRKKCSSGSMPVDRLAKTWELWKKGDERAGELLAGHLNSMVRSICKRFLRGYSERAQDQIRGCVIKKIPTALEQFRPGYQTDVGPYLEKFFRLIASRACISELRKFHKEVECGGRNVTRFDSSPTHSSTEERSYNAELELSSARSIQFSTMLSLAKRVLNDQEKQVFELRMQAGFSITEIQPLMNLTKSESTVRRQLNGALEKVRAEIVRLGPVFGSITC